MYIDIKLLARTIPFIEKVKRPRYAKYLEYLISPFKYSVEKRWVHVDIRVTTKSIIIVKLSTKKPNLILKLSSPAPISNHVNEASILKFGS